MKIGVGLLIDDDAHNELRDLELIVSSKTGNELGLYQPPHITIKRPFDADQNTFVDAKKILKEFCSSVEEFEINLGIYRTFGNEVMYAFTEDSKIISLQKTLLEKFKQVNVMPDDFDTDKYIAHSTIALDLSSNEFELIESELRNYKGKTINTLISRVGLFLNVDERHWIVVATEKFKSALQRYKP